MSGRRGAAPVLVALSLSLGLLGASTATSPAAAESRAADSAGSAPVGSASYGLPSAAIFVAGWGSDSNGGGINAPVRTLSRAVALAPSAGTVVLRAGSYNAASSVITKPVTIQNYPGEAVWLDGSTGVTGWVKDGAFWRHDGWSTRFDSSPTYTKGAPDSTSEHWQFLNAAHPMAAHPDQVWINDQAQAQVASLSQVGSGRFYLDASRSAIYVGSDPTGQRVVASNQQQALNIRAAGVVVRGIGIRRYAPSVWQLGAVTVEKPNATFENVVISEAATTGLSILSSGAQLRKVTVESAGMLGVHGRYADGLVMDGVLARRNNAEFFNIAPVSGGVKLSSSRGVNVTSSSFQDNYGPGFWEDQSVYNSVFRKSTFARNSGDGLFLEISSRVVVGDSLFVGNKLDGIKVNNTANVKIWNNTFVGNGRPLDLVQDTRRNTNPSDAAVDPRVPWPDPEMPWQLDSVTASNNVVGLSNFPANCLLCVEDYSHQETGEAMRVRSDGNVYVRASASAPTWAVVWSRGAGNPYVFTSLASFRSTVGQEARGREYIDSSALSTSGALASRIQDLESQIALPLPSDVAALIGQPSGSRRLGLWGGSSTVAHPPVVSAPAPASSPVLASDAFGRSTAGGWGSPDIGGSWSTPQLAARFAVAGGVGQVRLDAGDGVPAHLGAVSSSRTDLRMAFSIDQQAAGAGHYISFVGRSVGGRDYRSKVGITANGDVSVYLSRSSSGDTVLSTARLPFTYRAGDTLLVRSQVVGTSPTYLRTKVWKAGTTEPSGWTAVAEDQTSELQTKGSVGIEAYSSGSASGTRLTVYFDSLQVTAVP